MVSCRDSELKDPLKIGIIDWVGFYPLKIAETEGIYQKNGVSVEVTLYPDNPTLNEALKKGAVDIAGGVLSDFMLMRSRGNPIQVVAVTDYSNTADVIIGRSSIQSPHDLKGKKISFEGLNSFSHLFVSEFIQRSGIEEWEVQFVDLPASQVCHALEKGEIDAGHTWSPTSDQALKKGFKRLGKAGDYPGMITEVISTREDVLGGDHKKEQVRRVLKSFFEAEELLMRKEVTSLKVIESYFHHDQEQIIRSMESVTFIRYQENFEAFHRSDSNHSLKSRILALSELMNQRGILSVPIVQDQLINGFYFTQ